MTHEEYWYWLLSLHHFGVKTLTKLFRQCGTPEGCWEADISELSAEQKEEFLAKKAHPELIQREYEALRWQGIRMITREDADYPLRLKNIHEAPFGFFLRGSLPDESAVAVAMVGARKATSHGKYMAEKLAAELAGLGIAVISGLAEGIDGSSHRGCLSGGGKTYAVLGCGIDGCYPLFHEKLRDEILVSGGVISEYAPGMPGLPANFPLRNRIISGLSDLVLVVEARQKSGSLITVERALEQGREVMAVPGRPDDPLSEGCNSLLKQGAGLCTCADDILEQLELIKVPAGQDLTPKAVPNLSPDEQKIYDLISPEPVHAEVIMSGSGLSAADVWYILMKLELQGLVRSLSSGYYQRTPV